MRVLCAVAGCEGKVKSRGWCQKHYRRWQRHGSVEDTPRCHAPAPERVLRNSKWIGECLEFQGALNDDGYGKVKVGDGVQLAHRVIAEDHYGDLGDFLVCHHCDNPRCVNIKHLFLGTSSDNAQDREDEGRGNDITGDNNPQRKRKRNVSPTL